MHNIQEVIRLEGGNEYKEGRALKRGYRGRRKVGELFKHAYIQDEEQSNSEGVEEEDYEGWRDIYNTTTGGDGEVITESCSGSCSDSSLSSID